MSATGLSTYAIEKFLKHATGHTAWTMPAHSMTWRGHNFDPGQDGTSAPVSNTQNPVQWDITQPSPGHWMASIDPSWFPGNNTPSDAYWSILDNASNVIFVSRNANIHNSGQSYVVLADEEDLSYKAEGTVATLSCTAHNVDVIVPAPTVLATNATLAPTGYRGMVASLATTALCTVGGAGGIGLVSATINATALLQVGSSLPGAAFSNEGLLYEPTMTLLVL